MWTCFAGANTSGGVTTLTNKSANENFLNQQLAGELHKPIIGKYEKRKIYSTFKDSILVLIMRICN